MITPGPRAAFWLALAALAVVLAGFWTWQVHLDPAPDSPHSINDIRRYFHPSAVYMHDEYRKGNLPLWNPHQMAGMPFVATHIAGPLYPPNVLLLTLFTPARALEVHAVLHLLLAGVLTALFLRRLGVGTLGSFAAAVSFMLSGALLALFYSTAYVSTCSWLPGILLAAHGLVVRGGTRDVLALSGMLALAFLGGHAQGFVFEAQLAGVWTAALVLGGGSSLTLPRLLGLGFASVATVVGLVAVQLLPTFEMLQHVPRAVEGLSLAEASDFAAEPAELARGFRGLGTRFELTMFAVPLAVLGFWDRARRREWIFFALTAVVTGLFALGDRTPVFRLYHALPAGDLFRFPYRIGFVYAFCMSVLVGIGIQGAHALGERWLGGSDSNRTRVSTAVTSALTLALVVELLWPGRFEFAPPVPPLETRGVSPELRLALDDRWREGRVFIENFGRHHSPELPYLLGMMNGGFAVPTYEPMIPSAYTDAFGQERLWRGFANVVPARSKFSWTKSAGVDAFPPGGLARLLDLMSVRWYVTHEAHVGARLPELEAFAGADAKPLGDAWLMERRQALPRTYLVHEQVVIPEAEEARRRLLAGELDPRRQLVVRRELPSLEPAVRDAGSREFASIRSQTSDEVVIDAACASRCALVLTDLDYPGWEVRVDGHEGEIHRANTLFRAVALAAGEHEVAFRYRPAPFRIGGAISLATLLLAVVAGMRSRGRRAA